ncbi:MAG: hypothetical protein EBZ89_03900, partial [Chloroflexi bacterium]|nr:hypothetical protein [Chloroflexota bacterium]
MTSMAQLSRHSGNDHFTVGIIGHTGRGGYGHYLDRAFQGVEGTRVVAVSDPDEAARERVRGIYESPVGYADYREMLARERPDITVVASREIGDHHQIVMDVARSRSHVYLEKPVAASLAEVDDMIHACEAHDLLRVGARGVVRGAARATCRRSCVAGRRIGGRRHIALVANRRIRGAGVGGDRPGRASRRCGRRRPARSRRGGAVGRARPRGVRAGRRPRHAPDRPDAGHRARDLGARCAAGRDRGTGGALLSRGRRFAAARGDRGPAATRERGRNGRRRDPCRGPGTAAASVHARRPAARRARRPAGRAVRDPDAARGRQLRGRRGGAGARVAPGTLTPASWRPCQRLHAACRGDPDLHCPLDRGAGATRGTEVHSPRVLLDAPRGTRLDDRVGDRSFHEAARALAVRAVAGEVDDRGDARSRR